MPKACVEHTQRKLLLHVLAKMLKPCKKELRTLHTSKQSQGAAEFVRRELREVLDKLCWTQELVQGREMEAEDTRQLHPRSGWAEPIPCSLSPCQSQPPWDSELPKALNLCLLCT